MPEERPPAVPRAVDRRLVARVEQQHARPDQLPLGQLVAVVDDRRQPADQVVARVRPSLAEQVAKVCRELEARLNGLVRGLVGRVELIHEADVRRPRPKEMAIGLRDPEELGDHGDRQRLGIVGDEVDLAAAAEVIDQTVDDRLDVRPEPLDGPRRERAADETAQPRVVGRLEVQHPGVVRARGTARASRAARDGRTRHASPGADTSGPRRRSRSSRLTSAWREMTHWRGLVVPDDRMLVAESPIRRIRVRDEARIGGQEADVRQADRASGSSSARA